MVVLLLALLVVAWLAKDALTKYGLVPDMETVQKRAGAPPDGARTPAAGTEATGATAATPAPANPLEAARNLEKSLQQESEKRGGGY